MTTWRLLRRGLRSARRWWWGTARPSTGAQLAGTGDARPHHETGRAPTPDERWRPATTPTGPWTEVDPHVAPAWRGRAAHLVVLAWGAGVAWKVRGDWPSSAGVGPDGHEDARDAGPGR